MSDAHEELSKKIKNAKARHEKELHGARSYNFGFENSTAVSIALRAGIEIISALAVGAFFGYWIDRLFDTFPIGIIIMFFIGFIASVMNIYRLFMGVDRITGPLNREEKE